MTELSSQHVNLKQADKQAWSILVAEDDPVSGEFFQQALTQYGYRVTLHTHGLSAFNAAFQQTFALLILDYQLPGMNAFDILKQLRTQPDAACHRTPAIATSADLGPVLRKKLLAAGFVQALNKPVTLDVLKHRVYEVAPVYATTSLDDTAAVAKSGSIDTVRVLRELFAQELTTLLPQLESLANDPSALQETLHKLTSSCHFCGAAALASTIKQFQQYSKHHKTFEHDQIQILTEQIKKTLKDLHCS